MPPCPPRRRKMVFESVVVDVLNRFLGDYVVNLDESQLSLGIWKGNGVAAPGSREMAARFLVTSVLGQPGAATCSCPPRPSSYVKPGGGSRAGGRAGGASREVGGRRGLKPRVPVGPGAGDPWPLQGRGAIPGSFSLGLKEGSGELTPSRTPACT